MGPYEKLPAHITQSEAWRKFKKAVGIPSIKVAGIQFFLHKIPLTSLNVGYCPKVCPEKIEWGLLKKKAMENNCVMVRFDVPNVVASSSSAVKWQREFEKNCKKSPRSIFAQYTILLDLKKPEEELFKNLHPKTRYNVRLSQKHGVIVQEKNDPKTLENFLILLEKTAIAKKFYIHPKNYYRTLWKILYPRGMAYLLEASYQKEPLVIWLLLKFGRVLYYPYGGSTDRYRNFMPSNLIAWEAIRLGKRLGCELFDMWGATGSQDKNDPWYGFTRFKLGYGGKLVKFIDSYDLVIKPHLYTLFNFGYSLAWKILRFKRNIL